jgi:hypothetical protein
MHDIKKQLMIVWAALDAYRADLIPEGDESYDEEWNNICTAMAVITEDLGIDEINAKPCFFDEMFGETMQSLNKLTIRG